MEQQLEKERRKKLKAELKNGDAKMNDSKSKLLRKDRRAIESKDGAIEDNINCKLKRFVAFLKTNMWCDGVFLLMKSFLLQCTMYFYYSRNGY